MNDIQSGLLKLLLEIDEICKKNDIKYFVDGGSALGAVRHRGFLPWDDDADIVMSREGWNRFCDYFNQNPINDRIIASHRTNPEYPMVYDRYCDISTTGILRTSMIDQFQSGLFIDVFVLDPVPDTQESIDEYFDILQAYCAFINPYYYDAVLGVNSWLDRFIAMSKKNGRSYVDSFVKEKIFSGKDEEGMTYCFRFDLVSYVYPRYIFNKQKFVPMEGYLFPVPDEFGDYLRIHYGDLWYIIPRDTEAQVHTVVIDLDIPYKDFSDNYMYLIDRKNALDVYTKYHRLRNKAYRLTKKIDCARYHTVSNLYADTIERDNLLTPFADLLNDGQYDELREIFFNYKAIQLNKYYIRNRILVPLSDDSLFSVLRLMMHDGEYFNVSKILKLRELTSPLRHEGLSAISKMIDDIHCFMRHIEREEWQDAFSLAQKNLSVYPDIPDFTEEYIRAWECLANTDNDRASLLDFINSRSPEILDRDWVKAVKYRLLYLLESSREEAEVELRNLSEATFNGLIRLEIHDFFNFYMAGDHNE